MTKPNSNSKAPKPLVGLAGYMFVLGLTGYDQVASPPADTALLTATVTLTLAYAGFGLDFFNQWRKSS